MSGYKDSAYDHNCRWIVSANTVDSDGKFVPARYCEKKVGWKMVDDGEDSTTKVRYYDAFCKDHLANATAMDEDDENLANEVDNA
jgi:hypothetical protein